MLRQQSPRFTLLKVKPFCQRGQQGHQDASPLSRDDVLPENATAYAGQGSTCASVPPFDKKGVSNTSESQNQTLHDWPKAIAVTNSDPTSQHRIDPLTDLWAQQSSPVSSRNRCILHSARNFQKLVIHAVTLSIQPKQPWNAGEFMANGEGP